MDLLLTQVERKNLKLAFKIIKEWRKRLYIDPIWTVNIEIYNGEEADEDNIAFINLSNAEYFVITLFLSNELMLMEERDFTKTINDVVCHELVHLVSGDFYRTAQLAAGDNEEIQKEIKYKYEQFTSRIQIAFTDVYKRVEKLEELLKAMKTVENNLENGTEEE